MMSKQNVPELRFPEFSGEWEEKKLEEIMSFSKGKGISKSDLSDEGASCVLYGELYTKYNEEINEVHSKTNLPKDRLKYAFFNDVLIPSSGETSIDIATASSVGVDNVLAGGDINILTPKEDVKGHFVSLMINGKYKFELAKYAQGKTVVHLYNNDIKKLEMKYPSIEEQDKISALFTKLNRLIELEEKKLELLEEEKKGYMQKIFSQELRFKDENGNDYPEWEEKKLGEILGERVERSANGELLSVTISEGIKPFSQLDRKNNSSDNKDNYKKVYVGDIAYNSMRMWQGASGYSPYEGIVSPAYTVLYRKSEIDMEFMSYYFKTHQLVHTFKKFSQGLTSDTWNLKYPLLKTIPVHICSLNEQKKILSFFVKLDYRISQQKIKVNKMKLEKQGLIQRMFL